MTDVTEKKIYAKERYEKDKRVSKPISFNRDEHADLLSLIQTFKFGVWVKTILSSFNASEASFVKKDPKFVPSALVQHAIENGYFDLDEYLESKGKKIVDAKQDYSHHGYDQSGNMSIPQDFNDYNQEYVS